MDFCLILSAPWLLLLWDLGILTGEPLMLTKTLVLPTDLFTGGFFPVEVAALTEAEEPGIPLVKSSRPERTGEVRLLAGDEGLKKFLGEERGLDEGVLTGALLDGEEDVEF